MAHHCRHFAEIGRMSWRDFVIRGSSTKPVIENSFRSSTIQNTQNGYSIRYGTPLQTFCRDRQNELARFRNTWVEHQTGDRKQFQKFYDPKYAERLFDTVWHTIADILPVLLELHLPHGTRLIEQHPDDPGPRWGERFRYDVPHFRNLK